MGNSQTNNEMNDRTDCSNTVNHSQSFSDDVACNHLVDTRTENGKFLFSSKTGNSQNFSDGLTYLGMANTSFDNGTFAFSDKTGNEEEAKKYEISLKSDMPNTEKNQIFVMTYKPENKTVSLYIKNATELNASDGTMHRQALDEYQRIHDPKHEHIPLTGGAVKDGEFVFVSSTINATDDMYHNSERTASQPEKEIIETAYANFELNKSTSGNFQQTNEQKEKPT